MRLMVPALRSAAVLLVGGSLTFAQVPTPPSAPAVTPPPRPATAAPTAARPAQVVYSRGQIEVDADNSSLQQIFQKIARVTGMKITGGVADERVFGKYGPGAPAKILKNLLDGTGVNMLLKETATGTPEELILTPQTGPATPPNPTQQASATSVVEPDVSLPAYGPGGPQDVIRDINGVPVSQGAIAPAAAPPAPLTPDQLQQRIQQQQQQQQQQRQQATPH